MARYCRTGLAALAIAVAALATPATAGDRITAKGLGGILAVNALAADVCGVTDEDISTIRRGVFMTALMAGISPIDVLAEQADFISPESRAMIESDPGKFRHVFLGWCPEIMAYLPLARVITSAK